jgi:Domain of unknown function (DUF4398)
LARAPSQAPFCGDSRCRPALLAVRTFHILYGMAPPRAGLVPALLLAAAIGSGCGTPPQKEIEQARTAIETARAAGAAQYAPVELAAAVDALQRAAAAVAQGDYRLALNEALEASARAENAGKSAAAQQAALRADAERVVRDIPPAIDTLKAAITAAESARPPRQNRQTLSDARRAIVIANVALQKAREALGAGDYAAANAACVGVLEQLKAAEAALTKPPASSQASRPR